TPGSSTSASTRWTQCACGRIPTSFSCITTSREAGSVKRKAAGGHYPARPLFLTLDTKSGLGEAGAHAHSPCLADMDRAEFPSDREPMWANDSDRGGRHAIAGNDL